MSQLKIPLVLHDDDGIRPAGPQDACLYCKQRVGSPHLPDCVILERKVKLRYIFEIEVEVPWGWNESQILFHRNDGSWCADNAIDELSVHMANDDIPENGCLCNMFKCEVIEIPDAEPFRRNKKGEVVP